MTVDNAVALRIKQLLNKNNMTQYMLEKNTGILHGTMQCIMNGRNKTVTLSILIRIAKGFQMTVSEFLDDDIFRTDELELE